MAQHGPPRKLTKPTASCPLRCKGRAAQEEHHARCLQSQPHGQFPPPPRLRARTVLHLTPVSGLTKNRQPQSSTNTELAVPCWLSALVRESLRGSWKVGTRRRCPPKIAPNHRKPLPLRPQPPLSRFRVRHLWEDQVQLTNLKGFCRIILTIL